MALGIDVVVEDADDVGVAELGRRRGSRAGSAPQRGVVRGAQNLDGDVVAEQDTPGAVDGAHAATGEQLENLVAAVEHVAWREHADGISYDAT